MLQQHWLGAWHACIEEPPNNRNPLFPPENSCLLRTGCDKYAPIAFSSKVVPLSPVSSFFPLFLLFSCYYAQCPQPRARLVKSQSCCHQSMACFALGRSDVLGLPSSFSMLRYSLGGPQLLIRTQARGKLLHIVP